ncbi:MAG: hypothetical protein JXR78_06740 [Victivallales bacterium]|nr:hypothetical protein [Victivallales bacterium]
MFKKLKSHIPEKNICLTMLALVLCGVLFRMFCAWNTLGQYYTADVFRIGLIPWSDARGWSDGAFAVMRGMELTGYPAFRPLTPLFLSWVFSICASRYFPAMILQGTLVVLAVAWAFYILRRNGQRMVMLLFVAFLCVWRPGVETAFVTEVPGMIVLLPAFALLIRGFTENSRKDRICGIFLYGLFQAIRPWNIFSLALIPLAVFAYVKNRRDAKRLAVEWLVLCFAGVTGFAFHQASAMLFNAPGTVSGNHPKAIYGRVAGGSWMAYYYDPVIKQARDDHNLPASELRKIVYRRIWDVFKAKPSGIVKSSWLSLKTYVLHFPNAFGNAPATPYWMLAVFALLILINEPGKVKNLFIGVGNSKLKLSLTAAGTLMAIVFYPYFFTLMFLCGMVVMVKQWRSPLSCFAMLYFAGIILSLPLVGDDGHDRIKIGSDIFIFLITAIGTMRLYGLRLSVTESPVSPLSVLELKPALTALTVSVVIFFVVPGMIKLCAPAQDPPPVVDNTIMQKIFATPQPLLDSAGLDRIWNRFPQASFEDYNGRHAWWITRLNTRDMIYDKAGQGMTCSPNMMQFWPFTPLNADHTILARELRLVLFSWIKPEQLSFLDDKEVIVFGQLICRPRPYLYATGFILNATHLGWRDENGHLVWFRMPAGVN